MPAFTMDASQLYGWWGAVQWTALRGIDTEYDDDANPRVQFHAFLRVVQILCVHIFCVQIFCAQIFRVQIFRVQIL